MTSSSNQILKPTKASSSSGSNSSSPSASLKNVSIRQSSPSRDEKLIERLERDDSREDLIDFDKHGMTKFQHVVIIQYFYLLYCHQCCNYGRHLPNTKSDVLLATG